MKAPTIQQQTGWGRPYPHMMLQGFDAALGFLLKIERFDFDLDSPHFRFYAEQRGCLWLAGNEGCETWEVCRRADKEGQLPPDAEQRHKLACGRLQDCWELYQTHHEMREEILGAWVPPAGVPKWPQEQEQAAPQPPAGQMDLFGSAPGEQPAKRRRK